MSKLICIDAGHGGTDPGACGNSIKEKDITLKLAKRIGTGLKEQGVSIIYTRSADKYVALGERCRIANNNACDCFISVHNNSSTNAEASGIETLCYTRNNLAYFIQKELVDELKCVDRGVKERKDLYVLNSTDMQAVLVELGFISNKADSDKLKSDIYLDRAAECVVKGVCKYLGINYKGNKEEVEMQADKVNRAYKYGDKTKVLEVLNCEGKNYVAVRDIAELLGKSVSYDNATKITTIK